MPWARDKVEVADRGSPSRSVSGANKASVCKETASAFGHAAARRAAVRDFVHAPGGTPAATPLGLTPLCVLFRFRKLFCS